MKVLFMSMPKKLYNCKTTNTVQKQYNKLKDIYKPSFYERVYGFIKR